MEPHGALRPVVDCLLWGNMHLNASLLLSPQWEVLIGPGVILTCLLSTWFTEVIVVHWFPSFFSPLFASDRFQMSSTEVSETFFFIHSVFTVSSRLFSAGFCSVSGFVKGFYAVLQLWSCLWFLLTSKSVSPRKAHVKAASSLTRSPNLLFFIQRLHMLILKHAICPSQCCGQI